MGSRIVDLQVGFRDDIWVVLMSSIFDLLVNIWVSYSDASCLSSGSMASVPSSATIVWEEPSSTSSRGAFHTWPSNQGTLFLVSHSLQMRLLYLASVSIPTQHSVQGPNRCSALASRRRIMPADGYKLTTVTLGYMDPELNGRFFRYTIIF